MKLINLNVEGGVFYGSLIEFIKKQSLNIDIFCFQEIFHNGILKRWFLGQAKPDLFSKIQEILTEFNGYYAIPEENDVGGLAIFIKKSFIINKVENITLFSMLGATKDRNSDDFFTMGRNLQYIEFNNLGKSYTIFNFHGMWITKGKIDTDQRIKQSEKIREIFDKTYGSKILCGDLNISPDTKSLSILTNNNIDLTKKYGITSTRSLSKGREEIVDYIIVSPEVEILDFKVLKDEVSDHLPLELDFN